MAQGRSAIGEWGRPGRVRLLLASRNQHKVREIQQLLAGTPVEVVSLSDLDVPMLPGEGEVEVFNSFEQNALAKAMFYRRHTGMAVVADDSGLCVDALGGAPGVRSRRFAPSPGDTTDEQDEANNAYLLAQLKAVPIDARAAHYRCALALAASERTLVVSGRVDGVIALELEGHGGFGYDPLFFLPAHGGTFGQLPPEVKARISHRAEAIRSFCRWLTGPETKERA